LLILLALNALVARDLFQFVAHATSAPPLPRGWLILLQSWTLGISLWAAWLELAAWRRGAVRGPAWATLGRLLGLGTTGWLVLVFGQGDRFQPWRVDVAATLVVAAWSLTLIADPWIARVPWNVRRAAGRLLFVASATLILAESTLRVLAEVRPRPLLQRGWQEAREKLASNRLAPGKAHFRLQVNRGGHNDDEFGPKQPGQLRVVSVGDSFTLYMVPKTHHFTRVAELCSQGVEICNLGVAAVGPAEYLLLLSEEGLALEPDLVLVCLFIGNDIQDAWISARKLQSRSSTVQDLCDARTCLLSLVPRRLSVLHSERRAGTLFAAERSETGNPTRSAEELEALLPFLSDPLLEAPVFTREHFLQVECDRFDFLRSVDSSLCEPLLDSLRDMVSACGSIPLAVMLIPDVLQVEDELWSECAQRRSDAGSEFDRDRPQRILAESCAREGIPVLDILPSLRAVPPLEDGQRHLYYLHDTHFNARGNRVTGELLAAFLGQHLPAAPPLSPRKAAR
jgi:hypothetical protein